MKSHPLRKLSILKFLLCALVHGLSQTSAFASPTISPEIAAITSSIQDEATRQAVRQQLALRAEQDASIPWQIPFRIRHDTRAPSEPNSAYCADATVRDLRAIERETCFIAEPTARSKAQQDLAAVVSTSGYGANSARLAIDLARLGNPELARFVVEQADTCFWRLLKPPRDEPPPFDIFHEASSRDALWIAELVCKKLQEFAFAEFNPGLFFQEGAEEGTPELLHALCHATGEKHWGILYCQGWNEKQLRRAALKRLDKALKRRGLKPEDAVLLRLARQRIADFTIDGGDLLML